MGAREDAGAVMVAHLRADAELMLELWRSSLSVPEHRFAYNAMLGGCALEESHAILGFACAEFPGGSACWRFPLALLKFGFGMVAAQLAYDLSRPVSEPDWEGIRWVGQG